MKKSPAFQFYPNDFLGSGAVSAMDLEEVGAYWMLLCYAWNEHGLPDDFSRMARWCRVSRRKFEVLWEAIGPNFSLRNGRWYNARMEREREKQEQHRSKRARAAHERWHGGDEECISTALAVSDGNAHAVASTSSSSSTAVLPPDPRGAGDAERVLAHYAFRHPRRRVAGKKAVGIVTRALKHFSVEEVCLAIDGNAEDTWHRDRRKHELSYVLRDDDKISEFLEKAGAAPPRPPAGTSANGAAPGRSGITGADIAWA